MPASCEFICKNKDCQLYNTGFTMTQPWPMASAEIVIADMVSNKPLKVQEKMLPKLIERKNQGKKYLCITLPNTSDVEITAYRIQQWSDGAKCVYEDYVEVVPGEAFNETVLKANLPTVCPTTGCTLKTFNTVVTEGIECPSCKKKLEQSRSYSNLK